MGFWSRQILLFMFQLGSVLGGKVKEVNTPIKAFCIRPLLTIDLMQEGLNSAAYNLLHAHIVRHERVLLIVEIF